MDRNKGFALIFALWVLLLITVIGMSFSYSLKIERQTTVSYAERFQAEMSASSGTKRVILALLSAASGSEQEYNRIPLSLTLDDFKVKTLLRSEAGKVNLNKAPVEILTGLFSQFTPVKEAEKMAAALIDWRDPDTNPLPNGAEEDTYHQAGYNYRPKNQPLASISELSQIIGFNTDLIIQITPFVTIYSDTLKIDPLSATAIALSSLPGISPETAKAFIEERNIAFEQQTTVNLDILFSAAQYLDPGHKQNIVNIVSTVQSPGNNKYYWEASVLLKQGKKQYKILEWMMVNE